MTAAAYDFKVNTAGSPYIEQGADFSVPIIVKDESGIVVDLTGYTARMQIRERLTSTDFLLELTTGNGRIVLVPIDGKLTLTLTAAETAAITWTKGVYDLELVDGTGFVVRLLQGVVTISKEVTR